MFSAFQFVAWIAAAYIAFVTVAPIRFKPRIRSGKRTRFHANAERSLAFAGMTFLFVIGFPDEKLVAGTVCVFAAGVSELLQLFSATRHARWNDAIAKAFGAVIGVVFAMLALTLHVGR